MPNRSIDMDEFIFRAEQAFETLTVQLNMAAENGIRIARQYSDEGRILARQALTNPSIDGIKTSAKNIWNGFIQNLDKIKEAALEATDPDILYEQIRLFFRDEISRNNAFYICVGLGLGTTGGFLLGYYMARPFIQTPFMKAIACVSYRDYDNITLCKTLVPQIKNSTDILVKVRAVSVNRLDERISHGYGRALRCIIQNYNRKKNPELPLVVGRGCAGIIESVGVNIKSGLEVGDEVWVTSPWYENGLASEYVVVPESRIGRKPFIIGYEGAASLPYSGCVALTALRLAGLSEHTSKGKLILIEDGCSPVGCVLTQLTKKWGASVSATCYLRAGPVIKALGADDVIILKQKEQNIDNDIDNILYSDPITGENNNLANELNERAKFDVIFITTTMHFNRKLLEKHLSSNGIIINTIEANINSDEYGFIKRLLYSVGYAIIRSTPEYGGPHLCHLALDRLAGYVNDGILQTVVDSVYTPQDTERAITHLCSEKSIGSTIITFR